MRQDAVQTAADVSLLMKLQRRVTELEKENMELQSEMDTKEEQLQLERTKVNSVIYFRMAQFILVLINQKLNSYGKHYTNEVKDALSLHFKELEDCQRVLGAERDYEALKV